MGARKGAGGGTSNHKLGGGGGLCKWAGHAAWEHCMLGGYHRGFAAALC